MRTEPIVPARIDFGAEPGSPPQAPAFGDIYHPRIGAAAQARHVFLQGNRLPERWAGRGDFVIVETGFGLGNNFLATWDLWRRDPRRCARLHYVAIERHPPTAADLRRAHGAAANPPLAQALVDAWPAATPNLHPVEFDQGRVRLLLALGDVAAVLPALRLRADAFFLDGFAPARNPEMWQLPVLKALGRCAAPGATAATWSVAGELHAGLVSAGFEVQRAPGIGGKREITLARHAPRHPPRSLPGLAVDTRDAVVVGAGVAGAAVAQALARLGLAVTVLERREGAALEGSGNPAGIFHGTVNADDGRYARLFRAAALVAQREYALSVAEGGVPGAASGLLRLDGRAGGLPAMQALLARTGLPADYVQALDAAQAAALAGVPLPSPAWYYPGGGWVAPGAWVRLALATPGVDLRCGQGVAGIGRDGQAWKLVAADGATLARSALVVLANAADAAALLAPLGHAGWPLACSRGQVTCWQPDSPTPMQLPVAGDGYALPWPGGLLCGATRQAGDLDPGLRLADHEHNLERLQRLTGLRAPADPARWSGRVGWRLHSADRLPVAGAVSLPGQPVTAEAPTLRRLPREQGLFAITGLGARGLTLAPLLARLVAAQATGTPWPLEQDLADAVDPARWQVRGWRRSGGGAVAPANAP